MEEKEKLRIKKGDGARGWQKLGENVTQYKGALWRRMVFSKNFALVDWDAVGSTKLTLLS